MPYLALAQELEVAPDQENTLLAEAVFRLPTLTPATFYELSQTAELHASGRPRYSWALMAVADAAAGCTGNRLLQAQAAWHLARAANSWVYPSRAAEAAGRAEKIFIELGQPGWAAAARWQQNALPWARRNFAHVGDTLALALQEMTEAGLERWLPACRLSLAYARLLLGDFQGALRLAKESEQAYTLRGDDLGRGASLLTQSSSLRRQGEYSRAAACLEEALTLFNAHHAAVYQAQCFFQQGYLAWAAFSQYEQAGIYWQQAEQLFVAADLPLWLAQCYDARAHLYGSQGRLGDMDNVLRQGQEIYARYQIPGLWADNLLESSNLEVVRGNYHRALTHLTAARSHYEEVGNQWMVAVTLSNQGHILAQQGHYQQALYYLEQAQEQLLAQDLWQRVAQVEWNLAHLWLHLGQPQRAHDYLRQAQGRYQAAEIDSSHAHVFNLQAAAFLAENRPEEAITSLHQGLHTSQVSGNQAGEALACRLLGELLCLQGRFEEAAEQLARAELLFRTIGMAQEQALCQVAWGHYYHQVGELETARQAWEAALVASEELMPEIVWRARSGLATVAREESVALVQYRLALAALQQVRHRLWQPELVDSFLDRRTAVVDEAVALAARLDKSGDVLHFIEQGKAQILVHALQGSEQANTIHSDSVELQSLAAEMERLRTQMRVTIAQGRSFVRPAGEEELRRQLRQKIDEFTRLQNRHERRQLTVNRAHALPAQGFQLAPFLQLMDELRDDVWLALDYYLTADQLCVATVTATECQVWRRPVTESIRLALRQLTRQPRPGEQLYTRDLAVLGDWLLPPAMRHALSPYTYLLIAPHRQLHRLPWASLMLNAVPLVERAIPVILPSLHSCLLLGQRTQQEGERPGLLVGVTDFQGRRPALPQVQTELTLLSQVNPLGTHILQNQTAMKNTLAALARPDGLSKQYSFLHIASHAFHEGRTGRLSGIALYDGDLLLGELWSLAPLPPLISLSACSGSQSRIYVGDEHVSLVTTCLAAGAQRVVGSIWPVRDDIAPQLMGDFYAQLATGCRPAAALALAQRASAARGEDALHWGGFRCTGLP